MADKIVRVPRAEIVRLLGLSPNVDNVTLQREMDSALARIRTDKAAAAVSAAEQRARAEDRRIVIAAYNEGKITQSRIDFWCSAMQRDRAGNRAVLASLAPGLPPAEKLPVDPDVEHVHGKVLTRLGIAPRPATARPQAVTASSQPPSPNSTMRDSLGLPIPGVPAPVRLVHGRDPATWTRQERDDAVLYALGGRFAAAAAARGIPRPPGSAGYYQPSPNDVSYYDEAAQEWRPNPNYQPRGD